MTGTLEQRRVRFASIDGIERDDLSMAGEIWRDDIVAAPWADSSSMKLAAILAHYMGYPNSDLLLLETIDGQYNLSKEDVDQGLSLMRNYGVVESFSLLGGDVRAALNLSLMQRLKVLEAKSRFIKFIGRCPKLLTTNPTWLESRAAIGAQRHV